MSGAEARSAASSAAQAILRASVDPSLSVDGKWGSHTNGVYNRASSHIKNTIRDLLKVTYNTSPESLVTERAQEKVMGEQASAKVASSTGALTGNSKRWGDASLSVKNRVKEMIRAEAMVLGVPAATALTIAHVESGFNPSAVSPTGANGVFQLTGIAVKDVAKRGGYSGDRYNVQDNIRIGLRFIRIVARDLNKPMTDVAAIYMGFNIGPTGAKNVLAGRPEDSAKQIALQAFGGPQVYEKNLRAKIASFALA